MLPPVPLRGQRHRSAVAQVMSVRHTMSVAQKIKSLFGGRSYETMSLAELVTLAADKPTPANRDAFYRRLITSKVGTRVPKSGTPIRPGDYVTAKDDKFSIPTTTRPDGIRYLAVYCDIPAMFRAFPKDTFVELEASVVLTMAKSISGGIIVQNGLDGRQSWAGVPRDHVDDLLSGLYA